MCIRVGGTLVFKLGGHRHMIRFKTVWAAFLYFPLLRGGGDI